MDISINNVDLFSIPQTKECLFSSQWKGEMPVEFLEL